MYQMKRNNINYLSIWIVAIGLFATSCQKQFLEKKPTSGLVIPTTLEDFHQLLDNYNTLNATMPILGEASSDDYYLLNKAAWESLPTFLRNAYIWKPDLYEGTEDTPDWSNGYTQVFWANVVLEGLDNIEVTNVNAQEWNRIKGRALFVRAYAFFNLAQLFAPVYDANTASTDLGIPVRLTAAVDEPSVRASVQETYDRIVADLTEAVGLLPSSLETPYRNRANKPAAMALLSRVYLNMRDYTEALVWSNACLETYDVLIDYNTLNPTVTTPFTRFNEETLYQASFINYSLFQRYTSNPNTIIDAGLYDSYQDSDLRKQIYFTIQNGLPLRKASYAAVAYPFGGIAIDEVYVTKAECLARAGATEDAMDVLNLLWAKRSDNAQPFVPLSAKSPEEALEVVLLERRKELAFRGLRWQDLRRLNKEGANITLTRTVNGQQYTLAPNSPLYVLPIPPDEIRLSGLPQNERY